MSKYLLLAVPVVCLSACFRLYSQLCSLNIATLIHHQAKAPAPPPTISFYKLSLQWPPATCNVGKLNCTPPIPSKFTIHGIWPQDSNDKPIPPYNKINPCTPKIPTPLTKLPEILHPIQENLTSLWPNLIDGNNLTANYKFWEYEWEKHGTCSDFPDDPLTYFNSALYLRDGLNTSLNTIVRVGRGVCKTVQQVAEEVFDILKVYPEIACNKNPNSTQKQLWEIRLCYDRPNSGQPVRTLINCTNILRAVRYCYLHHESMQSLTPLISKQATSYCKSPTRPHRTIRIKNTIIQRGTFPSYPFRLTVNPRNNSLPRPETS
ncbi:hypothetical protein J1N35_038022 [Gossypium stocksii]|uniref:Uncharacterized protein n=1 Tax=Gossypium stocksii TaxID=47602 RepID=A0A9D3ZM97_9ROSI|nr:hypothetical protein J1N35_038022 [Gossypium stocksii]